MRDRTRRGHWNGVRLHRARPRGRRNNSTRSSPSINSPAAAALARENVKRIGPKTPSRSARETCSHRSWPTGNAFARLWRIRPISPQAEYEELDPSVRAFEPREALVSGIDGLAATRALFAGAAALLEPGGLLALEIDERRDVTVRQVGRDYAGAWTSSMNLFGRPRYALSIKED